MKNGLLIISALLVCAAPAGAEPLSITLDQEVTLRCERRWPNDYRMMEVCQGEQLAALARMTPLAKDAHADNTLGKIIGTCMSRWGDDFGSDYRMVEVCVGEQTAAARRLGQLP